MPPPLIEQIHKENAKVMTPKQIEIGDKLLRFLQEKGGTAYSDQYYHLLNQQGYNIILP